MQVLIAHCHQEHTVYFDGLVDRRSEFAVTVMYQPADSGGEFVYVPGLRSDDTPNHEEVAAVLAGDQTPVRRMHNSPGTLALFHGHNALHRVTPVTGSRPRINSVLTYGDRPDMVLPAACAAAEQVDMPRRGCTPRLRAGHPRSSRRTSSPCVDDPLRPTSAAR